MSALFVFVNQHPLAAAISLGIGLYFFAYCVLIIRRAREGILRWARDLLIALLAWDCTYLVLFFGLHLNNDVAMESAIGAGLCVFIWKRTAPRSRYIPAPMKRAAIARHLKKGGKYDPSKHHVDHIWPFSRGGSHTVDNLRIIAKKENLRKGAKNPRLRDLW